MREALEIDFIRLDQRSSVLGDLRLSRNVIAEPDQRWPVEVLREGKGPAVQGLRDGEKPDAERSVVPSTARRAHR